MMNKLNVQQSRQGDQVHHAFFNGSFMEKFGAAQLVGDDDVGDQNFSHAQITEPFPLSRFGLLARC